MIPGPFSYHRPATVADAVKLLSTLGDDARPLAGDLQAPLGMVLGIDQEVAETVGKRHEVAFGVDDGLLHPGGTLFQ